MMLYLDILKFPTGTYKNLFRNVCSVAQAVAKPQVENILKGFNSCCFAYGQTGSGT